jgi:hypothetical protein
MDKKIKKVQKDVSKGKIGKAKKDLKSLLKADKKQDAKLDKMKKGKC